MGATDCVKVTILVFSASSTTTQHNAESWFYNIPSLTTNADDFSRVRRFSWALFAST